MTRTYDMTNRARRAARTSERIVAATEQLLTEEPVAKVTLPAIAEAAGVSVQTVLRHMESRKGCFEAVRTHVSARVEARRGGDVGGDVGAAVEGLVAHYESEGRLMLNLLAQEGAGEDLPRRAAEEGRAYHGAWIERCFGRWLAPDDEVARDALAVATDLSAWKLLRLDQGRSVEATEAAIARLVRAVLART